MIPKTILRGLSLAAGLLMLASCNGSTVSRMLQASGRPGEVMLVMEAEYLETPQAYQLLDVLESEAPALPQEEAQLKVTSRIPSASFDGMMQRARNILLVNVDGSRYSKSTLKFSYDEWAEGQIVVTLNTPSLDSLVHFAKTQQETLSNLFIRHELYRFASNVEETYSQRAEHLVDSLFGYRINVPNDIRSHKIGKHFLWMSNAQMGGRHDFMVYTFPYRSKEDLYIDRLVEVRDSVLKQNIQGEFDNTYPSTVKTGLVYRKVILSDTDTRGELRGLWQMEEGAMMGGPFVLQAFHNKADGLVYVFDAFVYKPNADKLHLIRAMEAALYTARPSSALKFDPKQVLSTKYTKSF